MAIWRMFIHYLENLYLCCGAKGQTGVICDNWGQKLIFTKAFHLQITWHCQVTHHAYPSAIYQLQNLLTEIFIWDHLSLQGSKDHFH